MNHLVVDDRAVSRMHAWISGEREQYTITDARSRSGTTVNGAKLDTPHTLAEGDIITIGPARLTFLFGDELPPDAEPLNLSVDPAAVALEKGILFDCACGAPLWASLGFAGSHGQCCYCAQPVTVPHFTASATPAAAAPKPASAPRLNGSPAARPLSKPAAIAPPAAAPRTEKRPPAGGAGRLTDLVKPAAPAVAPPVAPAKPIQRVREKPVICGVCQSPISAFEDKTGCPACGLLFHVECWEENYGCSAYGCAQVNALKPPDPEPATDFPGDHGDGYAASPELHDISADDGRARVPWEFLLLAGSVFGVLFGALTFGLTSLAFVGGAIVFLVRGRSQPGPQRRGVVLASAALAAIGVVAGAAISYVLYFGGRHIG